MISFARIAVVVIAAIVEFATKQVSVSWRKMHIQSAVAAHAWRSTAAKVQEFKRFIVSRIKVTMRMIVAEAAMD